MIYGENLTSFMGEPPASFHDYSYPYGTDISFKPCPIFQRKHWIISTTYKVFESSRTDIVSNDSFGVGYLKTILLEISDDMGIFVYFTL